MITRTSYEERPGGDAMFFPKPVACIRGAALSTLPVGPAAPRSEQQSNFPQLMAVVVLSTIPIAIFYLVFQRYCGKGPSRAGFKG